MQIKIELMKKGDSVLNVWDQHIAIARKNGDVEIFKYYLDEDNLPRLYDHSILITQGNGAITTKDDDSSVEFGTF